MAYEHDALFLAKVLEQGYAKLQRNIDTVSEEAWIVAERIVTARAPLHSKVLRSGKVPSQDHVVWVQGAYGDIRIVSRDDKGTKYAVCYPENADVIAPLLLADKRAPKPFLKVGYYLHIQVHKDAVGWVVDFTATTLKGANISTGVTCAVHLDDALNTAVDQVISKASLSPVKEDRTFFPEDIGRGLMGMHMNAPLGLVMIGFLWHCFQVMMHGNLTLQTMILLLSWIPLGLAVITVPRWVGAALVRIANVRRKQFFARG